MKRWIILCVVVVLMSACASPEPAEEAQLRGWDGELQADGGESVDSASLPPLPPASVAFSDGESADSPGGADENGWINPEFVFQIRSGIPGGYGPTRLYAQAPDTSPHPCVDPADLQELAESEVLKAEWTAGLGRDDSSVVRVTAVGIGTNGGETGLRLFQATHRCDNEDLGSTTAVRDIAGLGELEIYQHPGSDSQPATWTTGFSRNNIFLIVIVQGPATAFDEAIFDRLALASHEELHKAVFQEQIAASDVE